MLKARNLGARLREAREKRGMTQEELAVAASAVDGNVSQASISALEKRDSKTTENLFAFAKVLRVNPEWLQDGVGESGLDTDAWRPLPSLPQDETELLNNYRSATAQWKLTLRLMAKMKVDRDQEEFSSGLNVLMAKIFAEPVSDEKVARAYGRPGEERQPLARRKVHVEENRTPARKKRQRE